MRRSTLLAGLAVLGSAVWLASRLATTQPTFALVVVLAVLLFSAAAVAAPKRN